MEVYQTQEIRKAEIDGDAKIRAAERTREATVQMAEATRQKLQIEGDGQAKNTMLTGTAQADVQRLKMTAEADGKKAGLLADAEGQKATLLAEAEGTKAKLLAEAEGQLAIAKAQEYQQNKAIEIMRLEVQQSVATAYASALQNAKVEYIGSGAPEKFMDLFTPGGGMNVGGALKALSATSPDVLSTLKDLVSSEEGIEQVIKSGMLPDLMNKLTPDQKVAIIKALGN